MRPGEELHGEIADEARGLFKIRVDGMGPASEEAIANGVGKRHVKIGRAGNALKRSLRVEKVLEKGPFEAPDAKAGAVVVGKPCGLEVFVLWHRLELSALDQAFNHNWFSAF